MDCEKFDQHVMDALYEELDELTYASVKRHMEGCSRCASVFSGLRATRDVGVLPLEEPSAGLEDRILAAALTAQQKTPWPRKALRALAWAGSHAMRPQLAMAALFVLVIGSSLLLLRPKPASMPTPVRVTERGVPAAEPGEAPSPPAIMAEVPNPPAAPMAAAQAAAEGRSETERGKKGDSTAADSETKVGDAKSALAEARAVRQSSGCGAAVKAYNDVGVRFPATVSAADAMWEAAECYKSMGDASKARELYLSLRSFSSYRDRAEAELGGPDANMMNQNQVSARAAPAPAPPASPPKAKAAAKPAAGAGQAVPPQAAPPSNAPGGTGGPYRASPEKAIDASSY